MNDSNGESVNQTTALTDHQNKPTETNEFAGQKLQRDELLGFDDFVTIDCLLEGHLDSK